MPPLLNGEEMNALDYDDESDDEPMSTEMLEDIRDGSQSHTNVNRIEARYKIRDLSKQRQSEWKGMLKATRNIGKGLHKVLKTVVKDILQDLPYLGESGSKVSYFIPEPRNFSDVKTFSDDIKKPWPKVTQKQI